MAKTALILLAAGRSTRFDGNKLLTRLNDETLIEHVVKTVLNSKADLIILVTGFEADKIRETLSKIKDKKLWIVYNPDYELGLSFSVKAGIRAAAEREVDAYLILPADVAFVTSQDIDRVIEKYLETSAEIVVASHKGRHGHPILFSNKLLDELLQISEETLGLKAVVERHRDSIVAVEGSIFTVRDIDTRRDLEECLRLLRDASASRL